MSAQAVQPAPAVQVRIPAFQTADAVTEQDFYSAAQKKANDVFAAQYKEAQSQLAPEMDALNVTWTSTQATATEEDLAGRIDTVIAYQKKKEDAIAALKKIEDAYTEAIAYCQPPVLDGATIKKLRMMNINVQQMEVLYVKLFDTQLKALVAQKDKVIELAAKIEMAYKKMKLALEPTAYRIKGGFFGALSYGTSWGGTPYVDALRDARKKVMGAIPQEDHKE
ncbi:MAG: hypothetical protein K1X28_02955 [Parachlamydiales bacterium]|nr:hypothetical protein [Parachlamydiales bacterium]